MDQKKLDELRAYYGNTDKVHCLLCRSACCLENSTKNPGEPTSAEIADAELDDEVVRSPMVGITVRLPAERFPSSRSPSAHR
jgi:hypothetical protein